jgi:hypothetical protein
MAIEAGALKLPPLLTLFPVPSAEWNELLLDAPVGCGSDLSSATSQP